MVWWFSVPKVAFGEDALTELDQLKGQRAIIVTDRVVADLGYPAKVESMLKNNGWEVTVWAEAESDPRVSVVKSAADAMTKSSADLIVAIGGGSVMDTAKAAWVLYVNPGFKLEELTPFDTLNLRSKARLVCIPTTAGTGSDATKAIVVREDDTGRKFATINPELTPDLAILEPTFVKDLPKTMTAYTGMDALTHAVESYASVWKNDFSDACSMKAVTMVFEWLPKSMSEPHNLLAREKMLVAANLAGMSFGNSQVSLAHSLGHSLGSVLRVQHGLAVGISLPYTIEYNSAENEATARLYQELGRLVGVLEPDPFKAARAFAAKVRELQKMTGFPRSLKEAGVKRTDFDKGLDKLVEYAMMDSSITMNPRDIQSAGIRRLYDAMFEGRPIDF
ncbi:MAG: iron-containing alcohol dehydrogenase [Candidatus Thorarchaeota archaeon]|nr:iron-containing alcohol dehydrogenase [Candidatus Thorarchaeota archaeon]